MLIQRLHLYETKQKNDRFLVLFQLIPCNTSQLRFSLDDRINRRRLDRLRKELPDRTQTQQFDGEREFVKRSAQNLGRRVLVESKNDVTVLCKQKIP